MIVRYAFIVAQRSPEEMAIAMISNYYNERSTARTNDTNGRDDNIE